jgi:hypothetical protein
MSLSKTVSGWADEMRKMQGGKSLFKKAYDEKERTRDSKAKALKNAAKRAKFAETNPRKAGAYDITRGYDKSYRKENPSAEKGFK